MANLARHRLVLRATAIVAAGLAVLNSQSPVPLRAQPTYKLDVKPELKPLATLKLDGAKVVRTDLADDPGFRLQYHVKAADGKTVDAVEARSNPTLELATKANGTFTVVLELFHPAYKGGAGQKGAYKAVSNVLAYKVEGGKVSPADLPKKNADAAAPVLKKP